MSTALASAFEKAGYVDPLDKIAREAWKKWPQQNAGGARRGHVRQELMSDGLLLALLQRFKPQMLMQMTAEAIALLLVENERDALKGAGGGRPVRGTHYKDAPANWSWADVPQDAGASQRGEGANKWALPTTVQSPPASITRMADRHAQRMQSRMQTEARLSKLDTVLIDGKKIGDCTVAEVREWAKLRLADARTAKRDALFAMNLTANLDGGKVIRDVWKPDDADKIYQRAEADNAA